MRSKCATSLPDNVNPINGRPARPAASPDLSSATPRRPPVRPRPAPPSGAALAGLASRSSHVTPVCASRATANVGQSAYLRFFLFFSMNTR